MCLFDYVCVYIDVLNQKKKKRKERKVKRVKNLKMSEVFGRYSIAIVTPFVSFEENQSQPIDYIKLENIIRNISEEFQQIKNHQLINNNENNENNIIGG